jgi:hypothetical protein
VTPQEYANQAANLLEQAMQAPDSSVQATLLQAASVNAMLGILTSITAAPADPSEA